jgi:ergothioneine biosynthesis protein EgtB
MMSPMPPDALRREFAATRRRSLEDCASLEAEDYTLQAAAFASPPKWHLAHTSWFFETFILKPFAEGYASPDERYEMLFNSYYNGIGEQHPRDRRGLLSRPLLAEVLAYREHVDAAMVELLSPGAPAAVYERCVLGVEHERQHQELMFTDIKYSLAANPMFPAFAPPAGSASKATGNRPLAWDRFDGGLLEIGATGEVFAFDNEGPRHRFFLEPFALADRLVTNGEYQAFIDDGGYRRPELWLADGWARVQQDRWCAPLHWVDRDGERLEFTLEGLVPRDPNRPVCHVSGFEADAYARWSGARLPTEVEWECAAVLLDPPAAGRDTGAGLHPAAAGAGERQYFGACWQWTQSAYSPYPGYKPSPGAIGEYNGKFMSNQWVLRGGSCVTWTSQARPTYRNFFYPQDRWQFSGIRLARDATKETSQS